MILASSQRSELGNRECHVAGTQLRGEDNNDLLCFVIRPRAEGVLAAAS